MPNSGTITLPAWERPRSRTRVRRTQGRDLRERALDVQRGEARAAQAAEQRVVTDEQVRAEQR